MVIYGKTTSKIENKTRPSLCLQTWLQQNLQISTNHKYRIYMDVFLQLDVLKTWRFVNLTFCKPWRFLKLMFQTFWNRPFWNLTFWNLTFCGCTIQYVYCNVKNELLVLCYWTAMMQVPRYCHTFTVKLPSQHHSRSFAYSSDTHRTVKWNYPCKIFPEIIIFAGLTKVYTFHE